jgi:electron transfer flavoprotein alpha subunit
VRKKVKSTLRLGKTWFIIRNYDCAGPDWLLDSVIEAEEAGNELTDAKHAVVAGRGLRNKQNMQTMYALAEKIKGKLGGTRAAVADGMLPLNVAVGSSGKVLCPDLCLTFGVSGAMPLMTGIEKSRLLISVNTDSEAAVFRGSDFGVCGDWKPVAETLIRLIDDARKKGIGGIDGKKLE